jgi:uncharacterized protein (TIGR03435 family)
MKKTFLMFLLYTFCAMFAFGQAKVGQTVGDIRIKNLLNSPIKIDNLEQLKGKVIWLEFWATWCSPCIEAMPHLEKLQQAFANKLQVIAISNEKEKRIRQFLANRPSVLWFAIDTAETFQKLFSYRVIPHAVLIDLQGKIVAITEPKNITKQVIADVLAGRAINLPVKEDNMLQDPWATYFSLPDSTQYKFDIQPQLKGLPSSVRNYATDNTFKKRRLTIINFTLGAAYRIAYGNFPYGRTVDLRNKTEVAEKSKMYCIDIVVPKGHETELLPTLRRELEQRFDLQVTVEKRLKPVYVLRVIDQQKIKNYQSPKAKDGDFSGGLGSFSGQGIHLGKIAEYLEGFGIVNLPVVDETNNLDQFDITFTYQAEKKEDLEQALAKLGLGIYKEEREINMLIFK